MDTSVKIISLTSPHENPQVLLRKDWFGYVVLRTEEGKSTMTVDHPETVTVPMTKPMGPATRQQEESILRTAYKKAADVYLIHVETAAGVRSQGMIAVPRAVRPAITLRSR